MIFETLVRKDAIDLLKEDHRKVESLFAEFESADERRRKVELAQEICTELTIHATIEEEIFYPAAQRALDEDKTDLIDEAIVEHASLKKLIADIDGSTPSDELFEANLKGLSEYVKHHVREEETELMPAVRRTNLDLTALGEKLEQRKQALKKSMASAGATRSRGARVAVPSLRRGAAKKGRTRKSAAAKRTRTPARAKARKSGGRSASAPTRAQKGATRKRASAGSRSAGRKSSRSR